MSFTVGKKLMLGFFCVSLLVLIAGIVGIVQVGKVVESTRTVIQEKVPLKDASMEALLSMEAEASLARQYLGTTDNLETIKSEIDNARKDYIKFIEAINQSAAGKTKGLVIKSQEQYDAFRKSVDELMKTHDRKAEYSFNHNGNEYNITTFLYFVNVQLNNWISELEDAAKYGAKFQGSTDATNSDFGIWYMTFKTTDKKLVKMLDKFNKLNRKAHGLADKVDRASEDKKNSYFERGKSRYLNKAQKEIKKLQDYMAPIFSKIDADERAGLENMKSLLTKTRDFLETLEVSIDEEMEAAEASVLKAQSSSQIMLIGTIIIAMIVALLLGGFFARLITKPLGEAVTAAHEIANGNLDFNININRNDELGQLQSAMSGMIDKLRSIIKDVKVTADEVSERSHHLFESSEEMSAGVGTQDERATQVSTAATEMSSTIIEIAKNASQIASSTNDTFKLAQDGSGIVENAVTEVKEIEKNVSESSELISSLGERSDQIGKIVHVINDIADQTNLLALNAAIEAARAGDQGRGFAVVADEVRKLAERTTGATQEIDTMIGAIQGETLKAVGAMKESLKKVHRGVELSSQAGSSLHQIVESIDDLQLMVQQIASATEEMSATADQITSDIDHIARITKTTLTSSDGLSQSSSDMAEMSTTLMGVVGQFKLDFDSSAPGSANERFSLEIDNAIMSEAEDLEKYGDPRAFKPEVLDPQDPDNS